MVDAVNDSGALSNTARQHEACRCTQVGCHDLSARKLLNAVANRSVAFDFRTSAHTDQFRNVHETVFEDRFSDHTGPFRHHVQQGELGLHVGRERRMRRGTYVHRFRTLAMHIQANPVFAHFDIRTGFAQLGQNGVQGIRLRVAADNFPAGDRRRHQEGAGFDTVRQNAINAAAQALHAFDGDAVGTLPRHLRAHRVEEVRRVDDFRLARGVFDDGGAFRQRRSCHDSDGRANADHVHDDMRAFQTTIDGRFDVTFFQLNFRA